MLPLATSASSDKVQSVIQKLTDWILLVSGGLAVLMYVIGGFLWMSDAGDAGRSKLAKNIIVSTTIGLIIVLMAAGIKTLVEDLVN
jgi:hypothetical protein